MTKILEIYNVEELYCLCSERKALISFAVTAKLIYAFVFAYVKCMTRLISYHPDKGQHNILNVCAMEIFPAPLQ